MTQMTLIIYILIGLAIIGCQRSEEMIYSTIKSPKTGQMIVLNSKIDSTDLIDLTPKNLRFIRNEIFARHGYIFKSNDLTDYFSKFEWYDPKFKVNQIEDKLTDIDQFNIKLIKSIEKFKNIKPIKWGSDIQDYLDLIPKLQLPFDFICEKSFNPAGPDYNNEIIKKYKPDGAAIIAKLYQDKNEAALI